MDLVFDELAHETELSWKLKFDGREVRLPKSGCELFLGDRLVTVPGWLAVEKGLEVYEV